MGHKINRTGDSIVIGGLLNLDGSEIDIATNIDSIAASIVRSNGSALCNIALEAVQDVNTEMLATFTPFTSSTTLTNNVWRTPYNTTTFVVGNISNFLVGDTVETQVDMVIEQMTVTDIDTDNGTITVIRGGDPVALADSLPLVIARSGGNTVAAYDDDDTEIEVDDVTPYAIGMVVEALLTGEQMTITDIDGNVLTVTRGAAPDPIDIGETLVPYGLEDEIAAGNSWDDYTTATVLEVADASIFVAGDTVTTGGETMTIESIENDIITVIRGENPATLDNDDTLLRVRVTPIPVGSYTLTIKAPTLDAVPRYIPVQVDYDDLSKLIAASISGQWIGDQNAQQLWLDSEQVLTQVINTTSPFRTITLN